MRNNSIVQKQLQEWTFVYAAYSAIDTAVKNLGEDLTNAWDNSFVGPKQEWLAQGLFTDSSCPEALLAAMTIEKYKDTNREVVCPSHQNLLADLKMLCQCCLCRLYSHSVFVRFQASNASMPVKDFAKVLPFFVIESQIKKLTAESEHSLKQRERLIKESVDFTKELIDRTQAVITAAVKALDNNREQAVKKGARQ